MDERYRPEHGSGAHGQHLVASRGARIREAVTRAGATWQIVGLGLRNPWRFSFDRTGDLWIADVGAAKAEEIDRRPKALVGKLANYGWSHVEGRLVYDKRNGLGTGKLVSRVYVYSHGGGSCGVIGGYVYRGARLPRARGRYFFGDLCTGVLWRSRAGFPHSPRSARTRTGSCTR